MAELLTRIHMDSKKTPKLGPLQAGYKFQEGWELVFSELEEVATGKLYNPCVEL
jgi:hypothetical protein